MKLLPILLSSFLIVISAGITVSADQSNVVSGNLSNQGCTFEGGFRISANAQIKAPNSILCTSKTGEIHIDRINVQRGASLRVTSTAQSQFRADSDCSFGDLDCNVCAHNVVDQFDKLFGDKDPRAGEFLDDDITNEWIFSPSIAVGPSDRKVFKAFGEDPIKHHVQGFVRTNHPFIQYAGTYSHKKLQLEALEKPGSIFFITKGLTSDRLQLMALHDSEDVHPSGMGVIGNFVIFGDNSNGRVVKVMNVSLANSHQTGRKSLNKDENGKSIGGMGGGVGMVKMVDGSYLLIMTNPGGPKNNTDNPQTYFYRVVLGPRATEKAETTSLTTLASGSPNSLDWSMQYLGKWDQDPSKEDEDYQYSENLSVITECGTGNIFVVHTSGLGDLGTNKKGYWRVSIVDMGGASPDLIPLEVYETNQNKDNCYLKAAATAWVNPEHKIDLVCHEFWWSHVFDQNRLRFRTRALLDN